MRRRRRSGDILTPREWQVLDLLRDGLTNEEIAERLGISFGIAKYHVGEVLSKLGVSSRHEAVQEAEKRRGSLMVAPLASRLRFPLPDATKRAMAWRWATGSLAIIAALAVVVFLEAWPWSGTSGDHLLAGESSAVGLDFAAERLQAIERDRQNSPFTHTLLLSIGMPTHVGNQEAVIASLARVETLSELQVALTPDVKLIVVDQSALGELPSFEFLYEQWQAGRAIVGLNVCFAELPRSEHRTPTAGASVREISPNGEVRDFPSSARPPDSGRCSFALRWAEAGLPYMSYVPRRPSLDEVQASSSQGINFFDGGSVGRLDLPPESECFFREMLWALDSGAYREVVPWECD